MGNISFISIKGIIIVYTIIRLEVELLLIIIEIVRRQPFLDSPLSLSTQETRLAALHFHSIEILMNIHYTVFVLTLYWLAHAINGSLRNARPLNPC
jgi:hypothetical protein